MRLSCEGPLDLRGTLAPLMAGPLDPTARVSPRELLRATRTPAGPATLHVESVGAGSLRCGAWGPGADWALARAGDLVGLADSAAVVPEAPPRLRELARRARGVRLSRTHRIVEMLSLIVLQQKVSWREAARAFRNLVRAFSEPAPGPFPGLWLPLAPETLRSLPAARLPPLGVTSRQAATLRELGWCASRVEEADALPGAEAEARLRAVGGIGPWSARSALLRGMGDADAVPLGDYNLPGVVAYNLAGEERADDARMLALLEPYRGQRGRVIRWLVAAGRRPPRRAPRAALRPLPSDRGRPLSRARRAGMPRARRG